MNHPHIMVATDLLPKSRPALLRTAILARTLGANVTLVHVVPLEPWDEASVPRSQDALEQLTQIAQDPIWRGVAQPNTLISSGSPARVILEIATANHVDLLVLGPHERGTLRETLKGLRTSVFASADDFLKIYDPRWRGCLLTDLRMPGTGGLELQPILRQREIALPVVVLTAHGDVVNTRMALKNGAVDFLEKPVDDDVLIDVLQNAIRIDAERHQRHTEQQNIAQKLERLTADLIRIASGGRV
jgi:CheY-like chemotaxis protein